jgi:hypothetical protein
LRESCFLTSPRIFLPETASLHHVEDFKRTQKSQGKTVINLEKAGEFLKLSENYSF